MRTTIRVMTVLISLTAALPASAAVLVDINADGTNLTGTTAHFEAATGLAAGTFGGDSITAFNLNGANVVTPSFDQTVDNVRIQVNNGTSTIFGDADNWFGGGANNNWLEDGMFLRHTSTTPSARISLSGSGLGLAANRQYELYLVAGRSQGHETTFTFNGTSIHTDPPVIAGDNTLGTAGFTFETGASAPPELRVKWDGAQNVNGNQDAVFSGFALRDIGAADGTAAALSPTVAYWQLDDNTGAAAQDVVGPYNLDYTAGTQTTSRAPDPIPNPDAGAFADATDPKDNPFAVDGPVYRRSTADTVFNMTDSSSFTFEGWFQTSDVADSGITGVIGGNRGDGAVSFKGWVVWMRDDGLVEFLIQDSVGFDSVISTTQFDDDLFHHVAAVWDHDDGATGTYSLYVDGILIGTKAGKGDLDEGNSNMTLGSRAAPFPTNPWTGTLDEFRFSDQALAPTEFLNAVNSATAPEPSSLFIAMLGCVSVVFTRRRRRR